MYVIVKTYFSHTYVIVQTYFSHTYKMYVIVKIYFSHTYEVSPAIVTLETYMFKKLSSIIGYPDGEGIFCPGSYFILCMYLNCISHKICI